MKNTCLVDFSTVENKKTIVETDRVVLTVGKNEFRLSVNSEGQLVVNKAFETIAIFPSASNEIRLS